MRKINLKYTSMNYNYTSLAIINYVDSKIIEMFTKTLKYILFIFSIKKKMYRALQLESLKYRLN